MSTNTIYLRTAKADREGSKLADELKRVLFLLDGRSESDDLAKRAAPSLRKSWSEIIDTLVKGGYIVSNPGAKIKPKDRPMSKSGTAASANYLAYQKLLGTERVIAVLEAAAAADKAKTDLEAKAKADTQRKQEKAIRTAELKTFFAAAKEKAALEIKQLEQETARAAAIEKERLDTEAKLNAEAKKREQENARTFAELERAINAAKTKSDIAGKFKPEPKSKTVMRVSDTLRLRELEIENEVLKQLLVAAYTEIAAIRKQLAGNVQRTSGDAK